MSHLNARANPARNIPINRATHRIGLPARRDTPDRKSRYAEGIRDIRDDREEREKKKFHDRISDLLTRRYK